MYPYSQISEQIYQKPHKEAIQRLIVIDGSSIGIGFTPHMCKDFDCAGFLGLIRFLVVRNFDVAAFMPSFCKDTYSSNIVFKKVLAKLVNMRVVFFKGERFSHANFPSFININDLHMLEIVDHSGGAIISKEKFDSIACSDSYSNYRPIIAQRRIEVVFHSLDADVIHHGHDRFFDFLPELCITDDADADLPLLNRLQRRLFCLPGDENYAKALIRREQWTAERKEMIIRSVDALFDDVMMRNHLVAKTIPVHPPPNFEFRNEDLPGGSKEISTVSTQYGASMRDLDPEDLAKRWLSPPAQKMVDADDDGLGINEVVAKLTLKASKSSGKGDNPDMEPEDLPTPSTSRLDRPRRGVFDDPRTVYIIETLMPVFDFDLIMKVLEENDTRDINILANLCAERTVQND